MLLKDRVFFLIISFQSFQLNLVRISVNFVALERVLALPVVQLQLQHSNLVLREEFFEYLYQRIDY